MEKKEERRQRNRSERNGVKKSRPISLIPASARVHCLQATTRNISRSAASDAGYESLDLRTQQPALYSSLQRLQGDNDSRPITRR